MLVKYNQRIDFLFVSRKNKDRCGQFFETWYSVERINDSCPSNALPMRYFSGKETESVQLWSGVVSLDNSIQSFTKFSFVARIVRRPVTSSNLLEP